MENTTERNQLDDQGIDAKTLKCTSKYKLFTEFNWLRRGHTRGLDYTQ
jgi:hypothetical protein